MKILAFIFGVAIGFAIGFYSVKPEVITKTEYIIHERVIREPAQCKSCTKCKRGIPPSYVLDLMKDCRAGKLDQSHPDITIRK